MLTEGLILARAIHFSACLLLFGMSAFDRLVALPVISQGLSEINRYWRTGVRRFQGIALPVILLSGIIWFVLVAMTMSGRALSEVLRPEILRTVWSQTLFGTVSRFRLGIGLVLTVLAVLRHRFPLRSRLGDVSVWLELLFSAGLLASLAWTGHGQEGQPAGLHLAADVLHLLVAGIWPAGLLPFLWLLRALRRSGQPGRWDSIALLVTRFSAVSLGSAALLAITGFINSWFLVGSIADLFRQPYGRFLLLKIILFGGMLSLGARNLLHLKPRLMADSGPGRNAELTVAQLQRNVRVELFLGMVIVVVVAILGILPPAIS